MDRLRRVLFKRAERRMRVAKPVLRAIDVEEVYLAGGGLLKAFNDLDIYAQSLPDDLPKRIQEDVDGATVLSVTKNAVTLSVGRVVVQLCKFWDKTVHDLIRRFDYAHCQVGVRMVYNRAADAFVCKDVSWTDEFVEAMVTQTTWYEGSEYPLSSLFRLHKYKERGLFPGRSWILEEIKILNDVIERGFRDYDDFKDQMDAVDIGLLPEDIEELEDGVDELKRFFGLLTRQV